MDPVTLLMKIPELIDRAQQAYDFVKRFQNASETCSKLFGELKNFDEALSDLKNVIAAIQVSDPQPDQLRTITRLSGNVQKCLETLDYICSKFNQHGLERLMNRFLWAYKDEQEVRRLQEQLEHHKSQFLIDLGLFVTRDVTVIRVNQEKFEMGEKRKDLIKWLKPINTQDKYQRLSYQRQEGTCAWFTSSSQFKSWRDSPGSILWLTGIPGAGKSVLAAFVIDYFRTLNLKLQKEIVISFFCDFRNDASTEPVTILRTLLAQLLRLYPNPRFDESFQDLIAQSDDQGAPGTLQTLVDLLRRACSPWSRVYIVIDAIDECEPDKRRQLLKYITRLPKDDNKIYLFFSSRKESDLIDIFHQVDNTKTTTVFSLHLSDHKRSVHADIARHISAQIDDRKKLSRLPKNIKSNIKSTLTDKAEGMFRWVNCQLDVIEKVVFQSGIESIDKTLRNLPSGLFPTYERILEAIENAGPDARRMVRRALRWLVGATRPLRLSELVEAIMLEPGGLNSDFKVVDPLIIVECCSSLVNYNEEDTTVSISHFSVQDFLLSKELQSKDTLSHYFIPSLSQLHQDITGMIFSYLLLDELRSVHVTNGQATEALLAKHPFLRYAACSWMWHFHEIEDLEGQQRVFTTFEHFLFQSAHALHHQARRQVHYLSSPKELDFYVEKPHLVGGTTPVMEIDHTMLLLLHTGPIWVLRNLCEMHPELIDRTYYIYGTPLMIATLNSDADMVKMLLGVGADVNKCVKHHGAEGDRPPLYIAIRFRPEVQIIEMMLEHKASIDYPPTDADNGSLIHCAAKYGRKEILQLLIKRGADVNTKSGDHTTPLHLAVATGSLEMVQVLVKAGSDVNAKRASGTTPLSLALNQQSTEIIQYLLNNGASPDGYINLAHLAWAASQPWYPQIQNAVQAALPLKRSKQDVTQVLTWLNTYFGLPSVISEAILDYAEYWAAMSTMRDDRVVVSREEDVPYLIAQPIEYGEEVRRIVFTTVSHDQGWGGEETGQGIYHGSNTWFEAGTSNPSYPRREIQYNVCADRTSRAHTNIWDYRDETTKSWLGGLQPCDMVAVYPKARYKGWSNHVQSVEIVVYIACKSPPAYEPQDPAKVQSGLTEYPNDLVIVQHDPVKIRRTGRTQRRRRFNDHPITIANEAS